MTHPKEQLKIDLKQAMRDRDENRKNVIRMALAAIKNAEIDKGDDLTAEETTALLSSEAKKRRESITEFEDAGRAEMAEQERVELKVLEAYLPQQMTRTEIEEAARIVIAEVGAESPKDIGPVMGKLMPQVRGKADGRLVNEVVRELLA